MSTGTPRPTFLNSKVPSDTGQAWMSFEESPVHSSGNVRQDERWTSFANASPQTMPVDQTIQLQLTSPGPNFSNQQLVSRVPPIQNTNQQPRDKDASILNRTGIGTEGQHTAQLPTHPIHPGAQSGVVTHGPGSTMSHILRHKSGDADHEQPGDNRTNSSKRHQSDGVMDTRLVNVPQQKLETNQTAENYYASGGKAVNRAGESGGPDPWFVTQEQSTYYRNQFLLMQPNIDGKIDGQTARNFFTKSRLPIPELSHIWELCDMDQDGHLTLIEFCAAFHLVVARKNNYDLPPALPKTLLPPLMKMCGISQSIYSNRNLMAATDVPTPDNTPIIDLQRKEETQAPITQLQVVSKTQSSESKSEETPSQKLKPSESNQWHTHEKWETFSDRTSSSTNLANFDQSLDHTENLIHPVPLRVTPSKHELHSAKIRKGKTPPKSTDDDEHHGHGLTVPPSHKSLTNPYGPLKNNLSEPDSHASPRARSSSNSSHSSAGTSDRSLSEMDNAFKTPKLPTSDQEYQSDWSSRPLQPRSASDSSIDSSSLEASVIAREAQGAVPTPPPRPNQQLRTTKSDSFEGDHQHHPPANDVPDSVLSTISAPTPPPRPQQSIVANHPEQNEGFADFSQFEKNRIEESSANEPELSPSTAVPEPAAAQSEEKPSAKPKPAPRHSREEKSSKPETKEELSPDKNQHRKAPTKPPRTRIQSVDSAMQEHNKIIKSNSVTSPSDNIPVIPEKPSQKDAQSKLKLQQSIRDLKLQNSKLTRLNADLQQELKDVMQSRITVEMSIHHLRPFTQ